MATMIVVKFYLGCKVPSSYAGHATGTYAKHAFLRGLGTCSQEKI